MLIEFDCRDSFVLVVMLLVEDKVLCVMLLVADRVLCWLSAKLIRGVG